MLASCADAQGAGSLGGSAAARCRRGPGGGLGALLVRVVGRTARRGSASPRWRWRRRSSSARWRGCRGRRSRARRVAALGFFAAFVAWNGISVLWSIEGDRSWAYFNRGLVYLALRGGRALARAVGAGVGLRAGRRAGAAARLGAAREGDPGARLVRARGAAELADRLLERARPAVRDGGAARAVAGGAARAPALAARGRRRLHLRARRRAAADLFARRRAGGGRGGRAVARARLAAGRERGGAAARRRGRARGRGLGVLAAGALLGRPAALGARARRRLVRGRLRARGGGGGGRSRTSARSPRSGGR